MKVIELSYPLDPKAVYVPSVVSAGYFDGVHIGHQCVIKKGINFSKSKSLSSSVMTFHPHPREILGKKGYTQYLTPIEDKLDLFKDMGIDIVYLVRFDSRLSKVSPREYIEKFIIPLQIKHVVIGFDFRFGVGGSGTPEFLKQNSEGRYGVSIVKPVTWHKEKVSSTVIRAHLSNGDISSVNKLLGRPFRIKGEVVTKEISPFPGFTKLNIQVTYGYLLPKKGAYGVHTDGTEYRESILINKIRNNNDNQLIELHVSQWNENQFEKDAPIEIHFITQISKTSSILSSESDEIGQELVLHEEIS